MKTMNKAWGMAALALIFALVLAACPSPSSDGPSGPTEPGEAEYTSYDIEGNVYYLVITQGLSRAAGYTPRVGDNYTLNKSGSPISSGTVTKADGGMFTLKETGSGEFRVQISNSGNMETIIGQNESISISISGMLPDPLPTPSPSDEKPKLGVAIYNFDDFFMGIYKEAIVNRSNDTGKSETTVVNSQNDQGTQNNQVDTLIANNKAIAINLVDTSAAGTIIGKAKAKGIPIVLFQREPSNLSSVLNSYNKAYYIGAHAEEAGTIQGEIAVEWWESAEKRDVNNNGKMDYLMLKGIAGNNEVDKRTQYSIKAVTDAKISVNKLAEANADWDRNKAKPQMTEWWDSYKDQVDVVFCNNDDMALGVIGCLEDKNVPLNEWPVIIGVDAIPEALQAIKDGKLLGTVLNDAKTMGKATYDLVYALAIGAAPSIKSIWVPYQKVTKGNVDKYLEEAEQP